MSQYVHYIAAGVGIQTSCSTYDTAERYCSVLGKLPSSPRPLMDSTQCLIMSVDATIAKAFVGAQDATTEQGIDLIFHLSSDDTVTNVEVMLAQRGCKELSPAEIKQYPELAKAAMLEELRTWGERFKVMKIAEYHPKLNVMTSRYVITWREVDGRTVMRYRLTLRGFQDWYKDDYETYAGTTARM